MIGEAPNDPTPMCGACWPSHGFHLQLACSLNVSLKSVGHACSSSLAENPSGLSESWLDAPMRSSSQQICPEACELEDVRDVGGLVGFRVGNLVDHEQADRDLTTKAIGEML